MSGRVEHSLKRMPSILLFSLKVVKIDMKQMVTSLFGMFGSAVALLFGGWDIALQTLVLFMGIDWIEYSCAMKSHFRKFGNQSSGTRKSPLLCLRTYPFLLEYWSRPCRICGA